MPKRNMPVEIVAALLLVFLTHSVISISVYPGFPSLKNCLAFYTTHTTSFAAILLVIEYITVILLFLPRTRIFGFILTMIITLIFAIIILVYPHYPHDFGGLFNRRPHLQRWTMLIFMFSASLFAIALNFSKIRKQRLTIYLPSFLT